MTKGRKEEIMETEAQKRGEDMVKEAVKRAREIAKQEWQKNGLSRTGWKKCKSCFESWKVCHHRNPDLKPPLFPGNYKGNCPVCGCEMIDTFPF